MGMTQQFFVFFCPGDFDVDLRTRATFLYSVYLPAKFDRPTFSRSRSYCVDKHTDTVTNKQTPLKTSTALRYATPVGITDSTENFCRLVLDFRSRFGAQNSSRCLSTEFFQTHSPLRSRHFFGCSAPFAAPVTCSVHVRFAHDQSQRDIAVSRSVTVQATALFNC